MTTKQEKELAGKLIQRESLIAIMHAVEKFVKDFEAIRDSCQVQVRIETLDRVNNTFLEVEDIIERYDSEHLKDHLAVRIDFEHRYCTTKGFLLSKRPVEANQAQLNNSFAAPPTTFHLRLPQIDLPRFNGDFSRWLSFRDAFSSMVHSNADIPTVAKLQYLVQSLEGDAKKPFESIDIEADNYASAWEALIKRYDNRRFLTRQLFRALYDLPAVKQESAKRIHSLVDDFQRHVRALEKLNEPVDHWDTPLVNILSYKLDQSTLRAWEEKTSEREDVKYDELVEFLYQRVRVLNSVGYDHQQQPASAKVAGTAPKSSTFKFAANASTSSKSYYSCPLSCSDSHFLRHCPVFLGKDVRLRREFVTQQHLCWNCLGSGHRSKKCMSKFTCRTCHERHHSLLHDSTPSEDPSSSAESSSLAQQPVPSTSSSGLSNASSAPPKVTMAVQTACSTVLLETVVLDIVDDHGRKHQARALLDSASMSNFISKPLAKRLFSSRAKVDISIAGIGRSTQNVKGAITATVQSRTQEFSKKLQFLVLKNPSAEVPATPINITSWNFPDVTLADSRFHVPGKVDLIIGSEAFWELHTGWKMSLGKGLPWVTETLFGWVVAGTISKHSNSFPRICNLSTKLIKPISDGPLGRCEQHNAANTNHDSPGSSRTIADLHERSIERFPATKETHNHSKDEYLVLKHTKKLAKPEETGLTMDEYRKVPPGTINVIQVNVYDNLFPRRSDFTKLRRLTAFRLRQFRSLRDRASLRHFGLDEYTTISNQDKPIRVGGRIRMTTPSKVVKHPIVLSAKHPLSTLLTSFFHLKLLHVDPQVLQATLRQKNLILGGRNRLKSVFHHCHTCFRSKPTLAQQSTADLPTSRVSPTRPFSVCGVDYCGPFLLKSPIRNRSPTKAYVAIFVCFATKAVHIELVSDLTTAAFLAALRRVVARRGRIAELHSDNATTFKGASHALNSIYRMLKTDQADRDRIFNWCADNEIQWKFIPPRAPHFGGLWEAAVKSAKHHLLKTIGNYSVGYEDMLTLLAQVEMCLNSRPLTPMSSEPSDLEVLTPGHFLVGCNLQSLPEADLRGVPDNRLKAYELTQKHLQNIWSRWYPEYLQQLQSRAIKGCNPPVAVEIDRLVIIKEDNVPPASWPLGRITKLHPGKDGVVRVVTLRIASGKDIVRPVARIALLPSPNPTL